MAYEASTEDIRAAWYGLTQNTDSFDLWLIKERERVVNLASAVFKKDEQDRIMALINETYEHNEEDYCFKCDVLNLIVNGQD